MAEKELHICGLGNGLVDVQVEISEQTLASLGTKKGTMTLVDAETQGKHLAALDGHAIHRSSGGSAANTMIAVAQFGGRAALKTVLGNDGMGKFYATEFQELGIHLDADMVSGASTGTCLILITPDAERTMLTALGVNQAFGVEHIKEQTVARAEWLYIEGYKFSEPNGSEAIRESLKFARRHGTKIAVSFSDTFVVNVFRDSLEEVAAQADLVFCNETEGMAYTGAEDSDESFRQLCAAFPAVACTFGGRGSKIKFGDDIHDIAAYHATPIDTTGAGDIFAAGVLYGITHGYSPEKAAHLGSFAAAKIVSQFGARLKEPPEKVRDAVLAKFN